MTQHKQPTLRERFDEEFLEYTAYKPNSPAGQKLKDFFSAELSSLISQLEGMKVSEFGAPDRPFYGTVAARSYAAEHNAAVDAAISLIRQEYLR